LDQISTHRQQERVAVILAGGEGLRLRSLTRKIAGEDIPKQFCPIFGAETLVEQTLRRVALAIEPTLTSVVLTRTHERLYTPILSRLPSLNLVVQPQNRGTAPAILYSLMRLADLAPETLVAIFPSDHFVNSDREFMRYVDMAFAAVSSRPELTILLASSRSGPKPGTAGSNLRSRCEILRRSWSDTFGRSPRQSWRRSCSTAAACGTPS
jgi:mannose-1-phosphate guanylyltransferase